MSIFVAWMYIILKSLHLSVSVLITIFLQDFSIKNFFVRVAGFFFRAWICCCCFLLPLRFFFVCTRELLIVYIDLYDECECESLLFSVAIKTTAPH